MLEPLYKLVTLTISEPEADVRSELGELGTAAASTMPSASEAVASAARPGAQVRERAPFSFLYAQASR